MEVLEKFLSILEQDGLKFTRNEIIPGFLIMCRVDKDQGGLTLIGGSDADKPGNGPEGGTFRKDPKGIFNFQNFLSSDL